MKNKYYTDALKKLAKKLMHSAGIFYVEPEFKEVPEKAVLEVINPQDGTTLGEVSMLAAKQYASEMQKEAEAWKVVTHLSTTSPAQSATITNIGGGAATGSMSMHTMSYGNGYTISYAPVAPAYYHKPAPTNIRDLYTLPKPCKHREAAREQWMAQVQADMSVKTVAAPTYDLDKAFAAYAKGKPDTYIANKEVMEKYNALVNSYVEQSPVAITMVDSAGNFIASNDGDYTPAWAKTIQSSTTPSQLEHAVEMLKHSDLSYNIGEIKTKK